MSKENNFSEFGIPMYEPYHHIGIMIRRLQNDKIFGVYVYLTKPYANALDTTEYHLMYIVSESNMKDKFDFITKLIKLYYKDDKEDKDCDVHFVHKFFEFYNIIIKGREVVDRRIYFNYKEYFKYFINKTVPYSYNGIYNESIFHIEFLELLKDANAFINDHIDDYLMINTDTQQKAKPDKLGFVRIAFAEYIDDEVLLKSLKEDFNGITLRLSESNDDLYNIYCSCENTDRKIYRCLYFFKYKAPMYIKGFDNQKKSNSMYLYRFDYSGTTPTIELLYNKENKILYSETIIPTNISIRHFNMHIIPMKDFIEKINKDKQENENRVHTDIIILAKLPEFYITDIEVKFVRAVCRYCGNEIPMEVLD